LPQQGRLERLLNRGEKVFQARLSARLHGCFKAVTNFVDLPDREDR
jgi:hypothetical protein